MNKEVRWFNTEFYTNVYAHFFNCHWQGASLLWKSQIASWKNNLIPSWIYNSQNKHKTCNTNMMARTIYGVIKVIVGPTESNMFRQSNHFKISHRKCWPSKDNQKLVYFCNNSLQIIWLSLHQYFCKWYHNWKRTFLWSFSNACCPMLTHTTTKLLPLLSATETDVGDLQVLIIQ